MISFYVGRNKKEDIVKESSSGGIMTTVATWILKNNGIVFGAALSKDCRSVSHISVKNIDDLNKLRKSKYVWSDFMTCMAELKQWLPKAVPVLFIGTPCQCLSVSKRFAEYENLYLLDFYCHGTMESKYYTSYVDNLKDHIKNVDFRSEDIDRKSNYVFNVINNRDTEIVSDHYNENLLTNLFVTSAGIRKACFQCTLCEKTHPSNLTMGDVEFDEMANNHGFNKYHLSIVAVNDDRGDRLFQEIKGELSYAALEERDREHIDFYYRKHENSGRPWEYNEELRQWFEEAYLRDGFEEAAYQCMYMDDLCLLKKYEDFLKTKKIFLYGAGKKGKVFKELIKKYYPFCNLQGYIVSRKEQSVVDGMPVYEFSKQLLNTDDWFIIISVDKKDEIAENLMAHGLIEGIHYGR